MFQPQYTITNTLLAHIKQINTIVLELNNRRFSQPILVKLEQEARAISAYASTSIEGNPLPLTDVKRILKARPHHIRNSEREVLNYNQALEQLNARLQKAPLPLTAQFILSVHRQVTRSLIPTFQCGKFRQHAVFVNNPKTGESIYLPPDAQDVLPLMKELITFVHRNKGAIDPLILAGIFHKQFVIIHPFMDGNGRTTRLITKALLAQMGLNTFHLFSFENYYNQNVTRYFQQVGVYGNYYDLASTVDFTPWLEYFTEGIIDELLRVGKELAALSATPDIEMKPYQHKMLDFIKEKGYITDRDYAKLVSRAKATRTLDFKKLINIGLLTRKGKGRATYYQLKEKS